MTRSITLAVPFVATALSAPAIAQPFAINWHTIDCGGGTSSGGPFELSGTIGQHDTGVASGGRFELSGGFWGGGSDPSCRADLDGDGDADVNDFFLYLDLFEQGDPRADFTGDGDVDVNDFFAYLDLFAAGC